MDHMDIYKCRLSRAMDQQLAQCTQVSKTQAVQYRETVLTCRKAMSKLKNFSSGYIFRDTAEEVRFFKEVKSYFYSRYIYAVSAYNYYLQFPSGSYDIQQDYIVMRLSDLKTFFDRNRAFYAYYRSGMTQLDELYYTRGRCDLLAEPEDFEGDDGFSASHDYKLSKVMANERFQEFLENELVQLKQRDSIGCANSLPVAHPAWTANLTDAVELIYALKASGAVNNGNIDISELVTLWEFIFQVDLKEYYHKFTDITRRKKDTPVFLNKLKDGLLRWIDNKLAL